MSFLQLFLCHMQDILLQMRTIADFKFSMKVDTDNFGVVLHAPYNLDNRLVINTRWSQESNEMIILFYVEEQGSSVNIEEWNIRVNNTKTNRPGNRFKQASTLLRSFMSLANFSSFNFKNVGQLKHELFFNVQNQQKRSDWSDASQLLNHQVSGQVGSHSVVINLAYQHEFQPPKPQAKPKRERFLSDGDIDLCINSSRQRTKSELMSQSIIRISRNNKSSETGGEQASANSKQKSFISLFSKREDVEILQTPDVADQILLQAGESQEYEIQMIIFEEQQEPQQTYRKMSERLFADHFKETPERQQLRKALLLQLANMQRKITQNPENKAINRVFYFLKDFQP